MTEKDLSQFGLLDEFSITELEERLEFEAWCNWNCGCTPSNSGCDPPPPPPDSGCYPDSSCVNENCGCGGEME